MEQWKLDKSSLRKEFSKDPENYYNTSLFKEEGFQRIKCTICGKMFWSIADRVVCDDPEHTDYSFFKDKPKPISYKAFWDKFAGFFEKHDHTVIKRYPVVSRWRQDLYFTIASIQDFQRIENGKMGFEYSANPLIVPQICLRFSDTENVGVTGRHFTSFMMAGQHAFDWPKNGYWRDETIELNYRFLTEVLGVRKNQLTYNEDVWAMGDFSEFGPCLESFSGGVELVNNVFTQFESVNGVVNELPGKVVDVGWGFERLMWFYTGFDNAYEAVFHSILKESEGNLNFEIDKAMFRRFATMASKLDVTEVGGIAAEKQILKSLKISDEDYSTKIKPLQALYTVFDHTRTLLFAISDGALPSNIGGGYNLRIVLRRAMEFIEKYNLGISLVDVATLHAKELKEMYPELQDSLETFAKVIDVEQGRYWRNRESAERIVAGILSKNKKIGKEEIKTLYESNGITPEIIESVAAKSGMHVDIPKGAYEDILKGDFAAKAKKKKDIALPEGLPKTVQMYYDHAGESKSTVLYVHQNMVVLDRTPFYPEGGGQAADSGTIDAMPVFDVQKVGGVVVHIFGATLDLKFKVGDTVHCDVDIGRRNRLIAHHTATHLISAGARKILGKHAWQEGARKDPDKAHIDIAHYEKLSDEEIEQIEDFANNAIMNGIKVSVSEMGRGEAETIYGFSIYQGHGTPAKTMRIVVIRDGKGNVIDAEACGGLHAVGKESTIGMVKIIGSYRIHDGVNRIEFVAGRAALDYFRKEDDALSEIARTVNTEKLDARKGVTKLSDNYRDRIKELDAAASIASTFASSITNSKIIGKGKIIDIRCGDLSTDFMKKVAQVTVLNETDMVCCMTNNKGYVVCAAGINSGEKAKEYLGRKFGFRGGGNERIAEGRIEA